MTTITGTPRAVALLDVEPDLAAGVPEDELAHVRRVLVAPVHVPGQGVWTPGAPAAYGTGVTGLVVLRGVLTRDVLLESRAASQLVGPGDVIAPWALDEALLPLAVRWTVSGPTALAVLDGRFTAAGRRWPQLVLALRERIVLQLNRVAVQGAIAQLPRVELRVLALLWHLADRWGRVTADGVLLPLALTHEVLGRLVGAQRPTVTLAVGQLAGEGAISRRQDGSWLLTAGSQDALAPVAALAGRPGVRAVGDVGPLRRRAAARGEPAAPAGSLPTPPGAREPDGAELRRRLAGVRQEAGDRGRRTTSLLRRCRATHDRAAALRAQAALTRRGRPPAAP